MNNSLLYFVHTSMHGKEDDVVGGELYQGTWKSAEGYAADVAFKKAKEEGMHIEVQWQDGDSSAAKSFRDHFTKMKLHQKLYFVVDMLLGLLPKVWEN